MISVSFVCKAQLIHLTLEHPSAFTGIPKSQCRISTGRQDAHETFAGLQSSSKAKAGERIVFVLHAVIRIWACAHCVLVGVCHRVCNSRSQIA